MQFSSLCLAFFLFVANAEQFCPSAGDFVAAYGSPQFKNRGWTITGGAGAATKASFNLLGGSVEYDVDFSRTRVGVNANLYTISPVFSGSFQNGAYCDGQKTGDAFCVEIDWIETNGNCGGATALHMRPGPGSTGCTAWGCSNKYNYNGRSIFHMKVSYGTDGSITIVRDGVTISQWSYSPQPEGQDIATLKSQYQSRGAVLYSSQWVGWVPDISGCSTSGGDLGSSSFSISNLVINGNVVQGPTPTKCSVTSPVPVTAPVPVAAPRPVPVAPNPPPASIKCAISGANNNVWYTEVTTVVGASVSVTCSSGTGDGACTVASWDATIRQCRLQNCQYPKPTCKLSGARVEDNEGSDGGSTGLAGWAIALIVIGAVVLVATIIAGVVIFLRSKDHNEKV